jgi:hypothetical protein
MHALRMAASSHPHSATIFAASLLAAMLMPGCGSSTSAGSSSTNSSTTTTSTPNAYTTVYQSLTWGSTVTVSFPSTCSMTLTTTGKPNYTPNPYYLAPAGAGQTVVAHTPVTNTALMVISYATTIAPSLKGSSATINICPTAASTTTATGLGAIGYLISGTAMFSPFEMDASTAAVADNASYTFTDTNNASADRLLPRPVRLALQRQHLACARQSQLRYLAGRHRHRPLAHHRHRARRLPHLRRPRHQRQSCQMSPRWTRATASPAPRPSSLPAPTTTCCPSASPPSQASINCYQRDGFRHADGRRARAGLQHEDDVRQRNCRAHWPGPEGRGEAHQTRDGSDDHARRLQDASTARVCPNGWQRRQTRRRTRRIVSG